MEIIDNINKTLKEAMIATLRSGSKVAMAASSFSIYAFQEKIRGAIILLYDWDFGDGGMNYY